MALAGKTIVFTGTLSMKRAEATKIASAAGAKVTGSVSKSTSIIVAGVDATSTTKVLTAKGLGTLVWSEDDFKKAVEGKPKAAPRPKGRAPPPRAKAKAKARAKPISEKDQHTFLDHAKEKEFDKVIELVKENADYINVQPAKRWSALHQAAESGDKAVVQFLIDNGADLHAKTKDGQTPIDVAKANVKDLLKPKPPKRKAPGGCSAPAKRGAGHGPVLHLFEPVSARELSEKQGEWFAGDDEPLCKDGVEHKDMNSAPDDAKVIAKQLNDALEEATLPAGESDCTGLVVVIANPGLDPKQACLQALAIEESVDDVDDIWDHATCEDQDFTTRQQFCQEEEHEDEGADASDEALYSLPKIKKATRVMAHRLKKCFHFSFTDEIVTAPQLWGGYTKDKHIVGVLGMRVWT